MPGVLFPLTEKGDRGTTPFNKAAWQAVAESLGCQDLAQAIGAEKEWRKKYKDHIEVVTESLAVMSVLDSGKAAKACQAGIEKARAMVTDSELSLAEAMAAAAPAFSTATVKGDKPAKDEVVLPYHGAELRGPELDAQCDKWVEAGTIEPACGAAIKASAPKLGAVRSRTFLVLGASSELGPVRPLLEAGATVAAVMRPSSGRWRELVAFARGTAGTLLAPLPADKSQGTDEEVAEKVGADLLQDGPGVLEWLLRCGREATGPVTLCTYLYADGEANVRLTAVADFIAEVLARELGSARLSFAYLASGSTSHMLPDEVHQAQGDNYATANTWAKTFGTRLDCQPSVQGAKLWAANHPTSEAAKYHFFRGIAELQGPNYALAQYMRQWRAEILHLQGFTVSSPVTPNCRTESVVHNATMRVILEGLAYWKPMESFDPDTARMAMLAVLISDLTDAPAKHVSPMHIFSHKAFHSGLWRCPFDLSSLGITTWVLGRVSPRKRPL
uniref:Uncharacterized protein n=1 Tax=Zooxanthella nutricula TaxID=1333877 RepID=A0A6U6K9K6_9DINO|mmetsp:Transcript_26859/g.80981  ORF Transcript_26859/g.80981 Transcript_26859/m.80981 type:complete len:501 (+) Transcript_26859:91-1593(+)